MRFTYRPKLEGAVMKVVYAFSISILGALAALPMPAAASEISTHVLDLATGTGGAGIPATLERKNDAGDWVAVGSAATDANGRVRNFGSEVVTPPGIYRIRFDISRYAGAGAKPSFPEIDIVFRADDDSAHYHVPVVMSPYGYSSYRGN
jgi:5-hydroxyisourate hydrolase